MGLSESRKYIQQLHKRQNDPFLWPDFLTGLPDKTAILRKLDEVYPRLGKVSVAYVRISNIQSFLIKYGPNHHADIIQWAAAAIKTTADGCKEGFAGTLSTHDFMVICESQKMQPLIREAARLFETGMRRYYSPKDLKSQTTLAFARDRGKDVKKGLMKLVSVVADRKLPVKRGDFILSMARACDAAEASGEDVMIMDKGMLC